MDTWIGALVDGIDDESLQHLVMQRADRAAGGVEQPANTGRSCPTLTPREPERWVETVLATSGRAPLFVWKSLQTPILRRMLRSCATGVLIAGAEATHAIGDDIEPFGAEDHGAEQRTVLIPEPMVFDLVRPLGARRGELEVNVLALQPMNDWGGRDINWAPEIEFAVLDGVAVEFELPFEGERLAAFKVAGQVTFGTGFGERFIHGTQFIAKTLRGEKTWQLNPLYLAGYRFDDRWSALGMLGYRSEVGDEATTSHELTANLSVFRHLTRHATAGIETNASTDLRGSWQLLLMPQLHYELTDHIAIQLGAGLETDSGRAEGTAGMRLIGAW